MHADARAGVDRGADALDRDSHVAEQEGIVPRQLRLEEPARGVRVVVPAPDENRRGDLAQPELTSELLGCSRVVGRDRPHAR